MTRRPMVLVLAAALFAACGGDEEPSSWDPGPECDVFADASCLDADRLVADVATLAAPAMTGRRAGTAGNDAAVDLIEDRFARLGLAAPAGAGSRRQPFPLAVWVPEAPPTLTLGGTAYALGQGLEVAEFSGAGSVANAPVVFAGFGLTVPPYDPAEFPACPAPTTGYDDFAALGDLTGKVVVVLRSYPNDDLGYRYDCPPDPELCSALSCFHTTYKVRRAATNGAAAVLVAPRSGAGWDGSTADHLRLSSSGVPVPTLQLGRAALEAAMPDAAAWEAAIDATEAPSSHAIPALTASLRVQSRIETRHPENVVAVVEGSDPTLANEVVVVGAHLDHMGQLPYRDTYYPGADDNASGTAVLMELARAVSRSATKPRRTLVFAAWNAEELGLIGSSHWVQSPPYPLDHTVAAFSVDMVGDGFPGMLVYGGTEFPAIAATMEAGADALALPDWPVVPSEPSSGSDHAPFALAGVPAVLFLTPQFEDHDAYHTPRDTPSGVSRDTLDAAAKLVWATVRAYALGTEQPEVATVARTPLRARGVLSRVPACFGPRPGLVDDAALDR
jgi:hypothetical protein